MNNIYFIGMCITMLLYIVIGIIISKKVKTANDYYVAGRNTPAFLITGSLVASFIGVGLFMGDVGECYSGFFSPIMVAVGVMAIGYMLGSILFGRYLRRSKSTTIAEYFSRRFDSKAIKYVATITGSLIMLVYMISCVQGIGTLMSVVTGISYNVCIILAVITFTLITIFSGAKGVLITDTIMFAVFTVATLIGTFFISKAVGGWTTTVTEMASYEAIPGILSWTANPNYFYPTGIENLIWSLGYGIAWMSVLMVAPWQSSRYLMAKDEHAVIRSSVLASSAVFLIEFFMCMAGVFVQKLNPGMQQPSHALIWAAMNTMPSILGIIVLSGVLAAGISSATTFLSLIGSNVANDILSFKNDKKRITAGRITILIASIVIMLLCIFNPPAIFWITYLGATVVACSWMPVALASVWSKKISKLGAIMGMIGGFVVSSIMKIYLSIKGITLPIYFDPFFVGMAANILLIIIGSIIKKVTPTEKEEREKLFIVPKENLNEKEIKKTRKIVISSIFLGILIATVLIIFWVIPYYKGL